jgi:hypothetical protein
VSQTIMVKTRRRMEEQRQDPQMSEQGLGLTPTE